MPVVGFTDENGERVTLAQAAAGEGSFAWPLPLTRAIAAGFRGADHYGSEDVLSATTLIKPPQIKQLEDRYDLWVDPLDSLWATYGTLMHAILEDHGKAGEEDIHLVEEKLVYDFEGQKVGGTIDRFVFNYADTIDDFSTDEGEGQDWKVTSAYSVKGMKEQGVQAFKPEYWLQANIYKYLLYKCLDLKALKWNLVLISRDWNERSHGSKILPVEVVPVPLMPITEIESYVRERVLLHKAAELCDDAGLPECTPAETWNGRRCARYCSVAPHCHQVNG